LAIIKSKIINSQTLTIYARALDDKASVTVLSKSLEKCRRSCTQKELSTVNSIYGNKNGHY
jgi:putative aminopeptidase FrvX